MVSVDIQNTISPLPLPSNPVVLLKMSDLRYVQRYRIGHMSTATDQHMGVPVAYGSTCQASDRYRLLTMLSG